LVQHPGLAEMTGRLLHPETRSLSTITVEVFGWLLLFEGGVIVLAPQWVAGLLALPDFSATAAVYFRLAGLLVSGLGMLYVVSGRLNAHGFVFASLLDRPLVPPVLLMLWYLDQLPAVLAVLFSLQDTGGFLWTLWAWRRE
jgi:hypothetical protein